LEPLAMNQVDGLVSVSSPYIMTLRERYQNCRDIPQQTIPFGAFEKDLAIATLHHSTQPSILPPDQKIKIVYIGRGGHDMQDALRLLFEAFSQGLRQDQASF